MPFTIIDLLISALFVGITAAITGVIATGFYLDNRVRREGHDLALRLERLTAESTS